MSDALTKLSRMTASCSEPTLSNEELEDLLTDFALDDADGNAPDSVDWTPTYNLRAAAREGWRWKAAKASELISSDLDGDRMSSNQLFEHCSRMIRMYAGTASPQIGTSLTDEEDDWADF